MQQGVLSVEGASDIPEHLLEEALLRAADYFIRRELNPKCCFQAHQDKEEQLFSSHWKAAELMANTVLWAHPEFKAYCVHLVITPISEKSTDDEVTEIPTASNLVSAKTDYG